MNQMKINPYSFGIMMMFAAAYVALFFVSPVYIRPDSPIFAGILEVCGFIGIGCVAFLGIFAWLSHKSKEYQKVQEDLEPCWTRDEVIVQISQWKADAMKQHNDPLAGAITKASLMGLLKGYKSTLILLKATHGESNAEEA